MIRLRPANEKDLALLVQLNATVQALHTQLRPGAFQPPGHAAMASHFADELMSREIQTVIAQVDSQPAGYVIVRHVVQEANAFKQERRFLSVDQLAVVPAHRRQGVGRALMAHARQIARDRGLTRLEREAYALNHGAQAFYASEGFDVLRADYVHTARVCGLYRAVAALVCIDDATASPASTALPHRDSPAHPRTGVYAICSSRAYLPATPITP